MVNNQIDENWRDLLIAHFSGTPRNLASCDDTVSGTVVANAPHGIYLDIGCGIPALLDIIHVDPGTAGTPQWTQPTGSKITAKVASLTDSEIVLHQMDMETW